MNRIYISVLIGILLLLLGNGTSVLAAIGFDSVASSSVSNAGNISWTHTVTSTANSNLILVVMIGTADATDANRNITAVSYAGTALTEAVTAQNNADDFGAGIWYLVNPTTGSNTVRATSSASISRWGVGSISLTGVIQTNPLDATSTSVTTDNIHTTSTVNTVSQNNWVVDVVAGDAVSRSVDSGQTLRWEHSTAGFRTAGGSTEGPNSSGNVSAGWSGSGSTNDWAHSAVSFTPASETTTSTILFNNGKINVNGRLVIR